MQKAQTSVFVFFANPEVLRNDDVHFAYRQESNFYYLSGFDEPESCLVLAPKSNGSGFDSILFVRKRNPDMELWEGERYGVDRVCAVFGVDYAYPIEELSTKLADFLKRGERIYYRQGAWEFQDRLFLKALEDTKKSYGRSGRGLLPVSDPTEIVGEMRLIKTSEEISHLRKAAQASAKGHLEAMKNLKPGVTEREIQALIEYHFKKEGCARLGYESIVAGGRNSTCLHYRFNNDVLKEGDLLLIDAAGEYDYYSADITRTMPVSKKFTRAQAQVYDLVLKAQTECVAMVKPGILYSSLHEHASQVLVDGMLSLGLLKGQPQAILKSLEYKRFYPHGTGHWLGMDVHDRGLYQLAGQSRALEAGMVFTIEPGFYVQPSDQEVPTEFRNIGVRIEDDVVVTQSGVDVLTKDVPKEREAIEALRAKAF